MKLLDTSYLVDYEQGRDDAERYFSDHEHEPLAISTISVFELAFGVAWSDSGTLDDLLATLEWADMLQYAASDALEGARIQSELQSGGNRLPIADVMLAGVARNRGATIVARDAHFDRVAGLDVASYPD